MKLSERINTLHCHIQELERGGVPSDEIDYNLLYLILEDAREFYETEGD